MDFKDYTSRPITRRAAVIPDDAIIEYFPDGQTASVGGFEFKCYEMPKHGDYVCYLSDDDIYHCNATVFKERNIV